MNNLKIMQVIVWYNETENERFQSRMHKIIFSHIFVLIILFGIWQYNPSVEGIMRTTIFSLVAIEMGFLAYYSKNKLFRVLAIPVWCFFYPYTFSALLGVANVSWGGDAIWSVDGMKPFMVYLGSLVFALVAGTLSVQLILKSFKLNLYVQLVLMPIIALLATFSLHVARVTSIGWGDLLASPINFINELISSITLANVPFVVGLTAIQMMMLILLGDE